MSIKFENMRLMFKSHEPELVSVPVGKKEEFVKEFIESAKRGDKFFSFEDHNGELSIIQISEVATISSY